MTLEAGQKFSTKSRTKTLVLFVDFSTAVALFGHVAHSTLTPPRFAFVGVLLVYVPGTVLVRALIPSSALGTVL